MLAAAVFITIRQFSAPAISAPRFVIIEITPLLSAGKESRYGAGAAVGAKEAVRESEVHVQKKRGSAAGAVQKKEKVVHIFRHIFDFQLLSMLSLFCFVVLPDYFLRYYAASHTPLIFLAAFDDAA